MVVQGRHPLPVEIPMSSKIFDLPRHKRPLWEVFAFSAALAGLIGLALVRNSVDKVLSAKSAKTAGTPSGYSATE